MFGDAMAALDAFGSKLGSAFQSGGQKASEQLDKIDNKATETAESIGKKGEEAGESFGKGLTLALAAAAAEFLDTMRETIEKASEYASNLGTLKLITGDDEQKLQQFEFAMRSMGVSSEQATQQLSLMQRRIEETASKSKDTTSVFYRLGLSTKELAKQDAVTSFQQIADSIASLKTPAEQSDAAMQAFGGRLGVKLLPLLAQGKTGIQDLMNAASGFGALIPQDVLDKLDAFDAAMKRLEQSTQAFFATMAGPIIPLLTNIANAVMHVYAGFERLSESQKLGILFAVLSASFLEFEKGLETVGSFLARNLVTREIIDFLKDLAGELIRIGGVLGIFLIAIQTNFGGARDVAVRVWNELSNVFQKIGEEVKLVGAAINLWIAPAFRDLSDAVKPFIAIIGDQLINAMQNIPWAAISHDIFVVARFFGNLIEQVALLEKSLGPFADKFVTLGEVVTAFVLILRTGLISTLVELAVTTIPKLVTQLAVALAGAFAALTETILPALLGRMQAVILMFAVEGPAAIFTLVGAIGTSLVAACDAGIAALTELATAEGIASLGITIVIGVIVTSLVLMLTHWQQVANWFDTTWQTTARNVQKSLATLYEAIADVLRAIGDFINAVPGLDLALNGAGDAALQAADKMDQFADSARKAAKAANDALYAANTYKHPGNGVFDPSGMAGNGPEDWGEKPGTAPPHDLLAPERGGGHGNAAALALDAIKDQVQAAKDKFDEAKFAVDKVDQAISALGKNATPKEINDIYAQKIRAVTKEYEAQIGVVRALAKAHTEAQALERGAKDAKDRKTYHDAARSYHSEEEAAQLKESSIAQEIHKSKIEALTKEAAYYEAIEKSQTSSYEQINAAQIARLGLLEREKAAVNEITAARLAILDEDAKHRETLAAIDASGRETKRETIQQGISTRNEAATVSGLTFDAKEQADRARLLADANDEVRLATLARADADAKQALTADKLQELEDAGIRTGTVYDAAVQANIDALNNLQKAQNARTLAIQKENDLQVQTSKTVTDVRDAFDKLIQSGIGGPLLDLFQGLQGSTINLTQGFIALFEQSRSFHDIQEAFKEITSRLAQVFDALRPVLDVLLGVLLGITDVFLELFNIMAEILNVFGLNIQKIKLLNNTLDGLDNSTKPLLQITHDLPTMNEFNSGKWASLQAQNNNNTNQMMQGFNAQATKLGEIVGVLIGIKVLMGVLAGHSVASQAGGLIGGFKNLFGLGGSKSSTSSPTSSSASPFGPSDSGTTGDPQLNNTLTQANQTTQQNTQAVQVANQTQTDNTASVQTQTGATQNLSTSMNSLIAYIPALIQSLGAKLGGGIGGALSGVLGIVGTIQALKSGATKGSLDTANFLGGGLDLLQGLGKGGNASQTLGGIGDIAGTIFGGPLGGAIGSALGTVIGSFFGPHLSKYKNPDIEDTTNYGQDVANIEGKAGANGQNFTEDSGLASIFGGETGASAMEQELSKGMAQFMKDTGLSAQQYQTDLKEFGASATGGGTAVHGKNIGDISFSGVTGQSGTTRYDALNQALEQFAQGLETASGALNNTFGNAADVNLASLYGNGQVVTTTGGYSVGGAGSSATVTAPAAAPSVQITIGAIHGTDESSIRSVLDPIMTDYASRLARLQGNVGRTSSNQFGREGT